MDPNGTTLAHVRHAAYTRSNEGGRIDIGFVHIDYGDSAVEHCPRDCTLTSIPDNVALAQAWHGTTKAVLEMDGCGIEAH